MTNTATRLWVAAFVLLVFVSGLSIGLAVSARLGAGDHGNRFRGPGRTGFRPGPPGLVSERIIGRLASEPDFTEDQRERLEALRHPLQLPVHAGSPPRMAWLSRSVSRKALEQKSADNPRNTAWTASRPLPASRSGGAAAISSAR